ncbi:MAG: hypothetical protein R3C09_03280 [Pirellulaceae bacterium]
MRIYWRLAFFANAEPCPIILPMTLLPNHDADSGQNDRVKKI